MQDSLRQMNAMLESTLSTLRNAAAFDELPGLYNRQYLQEALEGEVARSVEFGRTFSLFVFTITAWPRRPNRSGRSVQSVFPA